MSVVAPLNILPLPGAALAFIASEFETRPSLFARPEAEPIPGPAVSSFVLTSAGGASTPVVD